MGEDTATILEILGLCAAAIVVTIVSIVVIVFFIKKAKKDGSRIRESIKSDIEKNKSEKETIENSKVYLKYGKDFRGEYIFSGLFFIMFIVMVCLLFFVPAMEYRIELFGETVSEQEPTFLNMILDAKKQLDDMKIHSAAEFFSQLPQQLLFLSLTLPFIFVAYLIFFGLLFFLPQTYCLFVDKEEYEKISFMNHKGWKFLDFKNNMIHNSREAIFGQIITIPLIFVIYGIFRALFYHAEKDELLESLDIHMTMTVGMIFVIILAVLCLVCGIYFMIKYNRTKQKIMQEPIECETTETTETST